MSNEKLVRLATKAFDINSKKEDLLEINKKSLKQHKEYLKFKADEGEFSLDEDEDELE